MALCRTGALILKSTKPSLSNYYAPGSINMQVRFAARKGYREKLRVERKKAKESMKQNYTETKEFSFNKKEKNQKIKTVNLKKPEAPNDDVIIRDNFNYIKYSLSEAVKMHREYHHPTVYNNPDAPVNVNIEVSMYGKSQFSFIKPFSDIASIPYPFKRSYKKEILVLCKNEDVKLAMSCGASCAGCEDVIAKIKEGLIQPVLFDHVIAHISIIQHLTPIRNILKNQMPKAKEGSLTNDLKSAIYKFLHGIKYSCVLGKSGNETGFINCKIGSINMELEHLEENLKALIKDIEKKRINAANEFITWIWCVSPPSNESFSLDLSKYTTVKKPDVDDDEEEEEEVNEGQIREALKKEYEMEELLEKKA